MGNKMTDTSTVVPNKDRMLVAKEGLLSNIDSITSQWLKTNPLFFMTIPDTDLYETDCSKQLMKLFRSTTTLNNFLQALLDIDEDYGRAARFRDLLEKNNEFRLKFYRFFVRLFIAATSNSWSKRNKFSEIYGNKTSAIVEIVGDVFSLKNICVDYITQKDIDTIVETIIAEKISFKTYCLKNMKASSTSFRAFKGSGNQYSAYKSEFDTNNIWF